MKNNDNILVHAFRQIDGYLMGYDVFISYTWNGGRLYAEKLADKLRVKGYRCFLDSAEYQVGDDLNRDARRAVSWSSALAIVVTKTALCSKHVRKEIDLFDSVDKPVVPIDVDNTMYQKMVGEDGEVSYTVSPIIKQVINNATVEDREKIQSTFTAISRENKLQINEENSSEPSESTVNLLSQRFDFTRKVLRRLRFIAATSAILIVLTILSIVSRNEAQNQRVIAESALSDAIGVANVITKQIDTKLVDVAGAENVRDELLDSSYKLLESLLIKSPENKNIELARGEVAQNQGGWYFRHQQLTFAKEKFEQALLIFENKTDRKSESSIERLIKIRLSLGRIALDLRDFVDAESQYQVVLELVKQLKSPAKIKEYMADFYYGIGDVQYRKAELDKAKKSHQHAERIRRELLEESADLNQTGYQNYLHNLSFSTDRLGHIFDQLSDTEEASRYHRESYSILKELLALQPGNAQYRRDFALSASRLGYDFQRKNQIKKALEYYIEAQIELENLVKLAPASKTYRYDWAIALSDLGDLYTTNREYELAMEYYNKSLKEIDFVINIDPENATFVGQKMVTINSLAEMYGQSGDVNSAYSQYQLALEVVDEKLKRWPDVPDQKFAKAIILENIVGLISSIKPAEASEYHQRSSAILTELVSLYPQDKRYIGMLKSLSTGKAVSKTNQ